MRKIIYILTLALLGSCATFDLGNEPAEEARKQSFYNSVEVNDDIELVLSNETNTTVIVETVTGLLDGIKTELKDSMLILNNKNLMAELSSYDDIKRVIVPVGHLDSLNIHYKSSGGIDCKEQIKIKHLELKIWKGTGLLNLNLDAYSLYVDENYGTVDFSTNGNVSNCRLVTKSYGLFDCRNLTLANCWVSHAGINNIYVSPKKFLSAQIKSMGNIYYLGNPDRIVKSIQGSGKVIKLNE